MSEAELVRREPAPPQRKARRDDVLEVPITHLDSRGRGVGTVGVLQVVVARALPQAIVRAQVLRRRGARAEARLLDVLEPSPLAVPARCAHFGTCGGCAFQDLSYPAQLEQLRRGLMREFAQAGLGALQPDPVLPSPRIWHYRNKMDFTFGSRRWRLPGEPEESPADFALGLHVAGRYQKVLDIQACAIHFEEADGILTDARRLAQEQRLAAWNVESHEGLLRHLILRKGVRTGEVLVSLVSFAEAGAQIVPYLEALAALHPEITSVVQQVHSGKASVALTEREIVHKGTGRIREVLDGITYEISAGSFFQTNTEQAEQLLTAIAEEARVRPGMVVWDLYCGAGTIALSLARRGAVVYGLEAVASAVADARRNAAQNGIEGAHFELGEVEKQSATRLSAWPRPELCVVDPPRAGMHARALAGLALVEPERIVYVSCNAESGARDVAALCAEGYRAVRARPLDLFPHTPHVECVFTLERMV